MSHKNCSAEQKNNGNLYTDQITEIIPKKVSQPIVWNRRNRGSWFMSETDMKVMMDQPHGCVYESCCASCRPIVPMSDAQEKSAVPCHSLTICYWITYGTKLVFTRFLCEWVWMFFKTYNFFTFFMDLVAIRWSDTKVLFKSLIKRKGEFEL